MLRKGCLVDRICWEVELYDVDLKASLADDGTSVPRYTYVVDPSGEPCYFHLWRQGRQRARNRAGLYLHHALSCFNPVVSDLNLPVPFRPGDILEVDCRPFASGLTFCLLVEVGDGCRAVQAVYLVQDGRLDGGTLKHGHYFENQSFCWDANQISPLYKARLHGGELPEKYHILKELSERIHAEPEYGRQLLDEISKLH